jgi:sugar phosphate isomerase/epimerase
MKFGFPIWRGDRDIGEVTKYARRFGFDFVEVDLETLLWADINVKKLSLPFGLHAPYTFMLSHLYPKFEKAVFRELVSLKNFAKKNKALYLNLHFDFPSYRELKELNLFLFQKAIRNLKELIKDDKEVIITLENVPNHKPYLKIFKPVFELTPAKLCFDIGHLLLAVYAETKDEEKLQRVMRKWFSNFEERLFLVHLHNFAVNEDGEIIDHTMEGLLDLYPIVKLIPKRCDYLLLEIFFKKVNRGKITIQELSRFKEELKRSLELQC